MANRVILSEQFKVKVIDFINGAFFAIVVPVLSVIQELIPGWDVHILVKAGISALLTYIIKKLVEKPRVTTTYSTNEKAKAVSEEIKKEL